MSSGWPKLAVAEFIFAAAILAIGVPGAIASYHELIFLGKLGAGPVAPANAPGLDDRFAALADLAPPSAAAESELAFALRAAAAQPGGAGRTYSATL